MSDSSNTASDLRKIKLIDAVILTALLGCGGLMLSMRDQMVQLNATIGYQADEMKRMREQIAGYDQVASRVTRLEVRFDEHVGAIKTGGPR